MLQSITAWHWIPTILKIAKIFDLIVIIDICILYFFSPQLSVPNPTTDIKVGTIIWNVVLFYLINVYTARLILNVTGVANKWISKYLHWCMRYSFKLRAVPVWLPKEVFWKSLIPVVLFKSETNLFFNSSLSLFTL